MQQPAKKVVTLRKFSDIKAKTTIRSPYVPPQSSSAAQIIEYGPGSDLYNLPVAEDEIVLADGLFDGKGKHFSSTGIFYFITVTNDRMICTRLGSPNDKRTFSTTFLGVFFGKCIPVIMGRLEINKIAKQLAAAPILQRIQNKVGPTTVYPLEMLAVQKQTASKRAELSIGEAGYLFTTRAFDFMGKDFKRFEEAFATISQAQDAQ